jgi:hypothetical protein
MLYRHSSYFSQRHIHIYVVILQALQSALRGDSENVSCWEALADAYMARSVLPHCCHSAAIIFMSRPSFYLLKN